MFFFSPTFFPHAAQRGDFLGLKKARGGEQASKKREGKGERGGREREREREEKKKKRERERERETRRR